MRQLPLRIYQGTAATFHRLGGQIYYISCQISTYTKIIKIGSFGLSY